MACRNLASLAAAAVFATALSACGEDAPHPAASTWLAATARLPAAPAKVFTIRGREVGDLNVAPDGSIRVISTDANDTDSEQLDFHAELRTVSPAGRRITQSALPLPPRAFVIGAVAGAQAPSDTVLAYEGYAKSNPGPVHLVSSTRTGKVIADDVLQIGKGATPEGVVTGPTGAAVAYGLKDPATAKYDQQPTWIAWRRAGAAHFGRAVQLANEAEGLIGFDFHLGPDGGGVVLGTPVADEAPFVRRISPLGRLGPRLPLTIPAGLIASGSAGFGPNGDLTMALSTTAFERKKGVAPPPVGLYMSTLPRGSAKPSTPRRVAGLERDGAGAFSTIPVSRTGRTIVGVRTKPAGFVLLEGVGSNLRRTVQRTGSRFGAPLILIAPDGATTVLWEQETRGDGNRILGMRRPAGGRFGHTQQVSQAGPDGIYLRDAQLLPDGRVAMLSREFDPRRAYVSIVGPLR